MNFKGLKCLSVILALALAVSICINVVNVTKPVQNVSSLEKAYKCEFIKIESLDNSCEDVYVFGEYNAMTGKLYNLSQYYKTSGASSEEFDQWIYRIIIDIPGENAEDYIVEGSHGYNQNMPERLVLLVSEDRIAINGVIWEPVETGDLSHRELPEKFFEACEFYVNNARQRNLYITELYGTEII